MITESVELERKASPEVQSLSFFLAALSVKLGFDEKERKLKVEIEELREQVTILQGVIDESHKAMNEAGIAGAEGDLAKRVANFVKSKEGSIPRERMLQIVHRMQGKKRERHQND